MIIMMNNIKSDFFQIYVAVKRKHKNDKRKLKTKFAMEENEVEAFG